jgi:drug/metabolite transporter (DMT)-like permease
MTEQLTGTKPLSASTRAHVVIPFLICTLVWSSTWLVIRSQLGTVPPAWSVTYRFLIAAVAMMAYARLSRTSLRMSARQHGFAACYGTALYALNYCAVYMAERTITSGLVAVLFALLIVPNALFGWIFLKQGVSRAFLTGSGVAMVGLVLLFVHEMMAAPAGRHAVMLGIGWSIVAVLIASVGNVMQAAGPVRSVPAPALVAWGMAWGSLFNILFALIVTGLPVVDPSPVYWAGTLYLGLIGSAVAFTAYLHVTRAIGPARAAYTGVLTPVLAMLLSTLFERYRWSWESALGCALAIAGLAVALRAKQSARPSR